MTAGKAKTFQSCPNCKAPITETASRLTCRRCGHYLHDKSAGGSDGSMPVGALLGVLIVAAVVGFSCYLLLRPHDEAPTDSVAPTEQAGTMTDTSAAAAPGRHHRRRHH